MKKYIVTAAALMFLAPMTASASPSIAEYNMAIHASRDGIDYDIKGDTFSKVSGKDLSLAQDNSNYTNFGSEPLIWNETFCVSNDPLTVDVVKKYSLYKISDVTFTYIRPTTTPLNTANFLSWTANRYAVETKSSETIQEDDKRTAQRAIWWYLGITGGQESAFNTVVGLFNSAGDQGKYTYDWLVGVNGNLGGGGCNNGQDFLVHSPVPVPSSVLLLGSGLLGLVGLGRRKER